MNIHKHSITYALATGIVVIVFSLCIYLAGLTNPAWNYLSYIFYIGLLVYALKNWRDKEKKGILSYGQAMGYSTVFALYYIILIVIWTLVFMIYIAPGFMASQMDKQQAIMEQRGMSPEQVEIAMKYARMFSQPAIIAVFAFFGGMFLLSIINLIVCAIVKKDAEDQFNSPAA